MSHTNNKEVRQKLIEVYYKDFNNYSDIDVKFEDVYNFLHQELQRAREEALARERQLKQVHMMELDAISCKSIEDFVVWRDHRKQRPIQSELDQPTV